MIIKGNAYVKDRISNVCIRIENEIITNISRSDCKDDKIIDFSGEARVILPGMIDIHVHLRDFYQDYKEDFYTGTSAAAAGGVTVVLDMPNTMPRTSEIEVLKERVETARKKAIVDFGLYYGVPDDMKEIYGYEKYAIGLKVYPEDMIVRKETLEKILEYNAERNILTVFHPEDPQLINNVHPLKAELKASYDIALKAKKLGLKTHITHISSGATARILRRYNNMASLDTCPHYLFISRDRCRDKYCSVTPPLRDENTRRDLFKLFIDGYIDMLATDHAPHTYEEKYIEGVNGFPGLETALPLMLNLYNKGLISLRDIIRLYSYNPARLVGIDNLFGSIDIGKYASITVVDLKTEYRIDASRFYSKAKHSPFDRWMIKGKVLATFVRGDPVFMNDEILTSKPLGRNILEMDRR